MKISAFSNEGEFYKGNLHTHSELSDGKLSIAQLVDIYKNLGYDFIAVTDHNRVYKTDEFKDVIHIVPGLEIHSIKPGFHKTHHIVALTTRGNEMVSHGQRIENLPWTEALQSVEALADMMKKLGFDLIYCHPVWSRMDPEEYMGADFMAVEIYNGICEFKYNHGNSEYQWDYILRRGKEVWGVAADDCHGGDDHNGRGFVMVKTPKLDDEGILNALRSGNFYSSRGPLIHDFYIEDGVAVVKCSPASRITFVAYEFLGGSFIFDKPVEEYKFKFNPNIDYIRVEVEDSKGLKAWTNPIFIK